MIPSSNIFGLLEPNDRQCRVLGYVMGHSQLFVRVSMPPGVDVDTDEIMCLGFEGVLYFEGPMWWQGADFRIGTREEHLAILKRANKSDFEGNGEDAEYALRMYRLFVLDRPNTQVRIVATMALRAKRCPEISIAPISIPFDKIDITPPWLIS
jgi:hypothetical protein